MRVDVIIPAYKPDKSFLELIQKLFSQTVRPERVIIINTEEKYLNNLIYGTDFKERYKDVVIKNISKLEFNHGRTRNYGAKKSDADAIIFMTQDAMPDNEYLIEELIKPLLDDSIAVSYARQLPRQDASPIEVFSRGFNYPDKDLVKYKKDLDTLGIKTYFCSNVCAAYNTQIFNRLGGFVDFTIFNEDMLYAAKAINEGYGICYAAKARVVHSHNYNGRQQLRRNFDLGVSQADHPEVFEGIKSESEGIRMVKQTISYLMKQRKPHLIPYLIYLSYSKLRGYRLGRRYRKLSKNKILKYTMSPEYFQRYWDKNEIPENVYAGYGKNEQGL